MRGAAPTPHASRNALAPMDALATAPTTTPQLQHTHTHNPHRTSLPRSPRLEVTATRAARPPHDRHPCPADLCPADPLPPSTQLLVYRGQLDGDAPLDASIGGVYKCMLVFRIVRDGTVWFCVVLYCIRVWYGIVSYCIVLYRILSYCIVSSCVVW